MQIIHDLFIIFMALDEISAAVMRHPGCSKARVTAKQPLPLQRSKTNGSLFPLHIMACWGFGYVFYRSLKDSLQAEHRA